MYMIAKIISAIAKCLDDVFKNTRCYSRWCEVNEWSCSNVEEQDDNIEVVISDRHHHHQHRSHEPENNDDELERGV